MKLQTVFMIFKKENTDREFRLCWHHDFTSMDSAQFRVELLQKKNPDTQYKIIEAREHNHNIF